jgi:hypothetical protein
MPSVAYAEHGKKKARFFLFFNFNGLLHFIAGTSMCRETSAQLRRGSRSDCAPLVARLSAAGATQPPSSTPVAIRWQQADFLAFGERALFWPKHGTLLLSDLHLGKAAHFRRAGIAVPAGTTKADLARLERLIVGCQPARVLILGDVLHSSAAQANWHTHWHEFRARHQGVQIAALIGNHDRALVNAGLAIDVLGSSTSIDGIELRHDPLDGRVHICGHIHPAIKLAGLPRLPAFVFGNTQLLLPAFSDFTGSFVVKPAAGDRVVVCTDDGAVAI